jgi:hypothetical protein
MAKPVLPRFRLSRFNLLGGLVVFAVFAIAQSGAVRAAECLRAAIFGQVASRPAPGRPTAPGAEKAKSDKEKVEIPHLLDWLNDDWVIISIMIIIFVIVILWAYVKFFHRLDTAAYLQRPSPRGVLYIPQEIVELVDAQVRGQSVPAEQRQKLIDAYTLRYYFGGQEVVCRQSPQGLAALAVGPEEVKTLLDKMTPEEKATVRVEKPEPWDAGPIAP